MIAIRFFHDPFSRRMTVPVACALLVFLGARALSAESTSRFQAISNSAIGAGDVIVHGQSGGLIFGFGVDPFGSEGLLCEAVPNSDGTVSAAIETFDQITGEIISVLKSSRSQDDFVT